ncbi:ABC transporter permease subunit [Bradyrhizobium neotropicale]|uniref:ABC transporter permease n=1 Tax=Bradyrhizobium neotropicale TaxID=1497615 RepID=UPI001AD70BF9|nr:ABC transporter permease subunit [Bradyrhizobium neotropicale]MBO4224409.1 ABC transporter permease subunit [Bradyrhizobium neotropicale]
MKRSPGTLLLRWSGRILVAAVLLFVLLPGIVVAISAFNDRAILLFPPQSWSLRWFWRAFSYPDFAKGFWNGLTVTVWASSIALVVGSAFAFAIHRYKFRLRNLLEGILLSPLIIPHYTIGLGVLILASQTNLGRGFPLVIFAHVVMVLPFVMRSTYISLQNLDIRLELAASSLGATPLRILFTVTIPLLIPGLLSGWLFAAILSFNEFTATLFVSSQATQTLPVAMYNYVREFADPTLAALSVIYIVVTATLLTIANSFLGLGKILNVDAH